MNPLLSSPIPLSGGVTETRLENVTLLYEERGNLLSFKACKRKTTTRKKSRIPKTRVNEVIFLSRYDQVSVSPDLVWERS